MVLTEPAAIFRITEFLTALLMTVAVMTAQSMPGNEPPMLIVKLADVAPAGTVTLTGTDAVAGLLLTRLSVRAALEEPGKLTVAVTDLLEVGLIESVNAGLAEIGTARITARLAWL